MKKCGKCGQEKTEDSYSKRTKSKDGLLSICKECDNQKHKEYFKSKKGICSKIYEGQKSSSKTRGHKPPEYTLKEFKDWMYSQPNFEAIWKDYVASNKDKALKPSVDRLDESKGYFFGNIRLVTWSQNQRKQRFNRKYFNPNRVVKSHGNKKKIVQVTKDGEYVALYDSVSEAAKLNNALQGNISLCLTGRTNSAYGYKWIYR